MRSLNFNGPKSLNYFSGMPQMGMTLNGWQVSLTLEKVIQKIENGLAVFDTQLISFQGVWQPLRDEELQFKPEGQRSWEWIWIHAVSGSLNLATADKVIFNQKKYKVMTVKDYSLNGFIEYHLVRDYEENPVKE